MVGFIPTKSTQTIQLSNEAIFHVKTHVTDVIIEKKIFNDFISNTSLEYCQASRLKQYVAALLILGC